MFTIKLKGEKELVAFLRKIPRGAKFAAMKAFSTYELGDDRHGLKHYPPWKGQKYVRTFKLKRGWKLQAQGSDWRRVSLYNKVPYTPYVPRWKKYGWREWMQAVRDNMAGALRSAQAAVNKWLREHNRG